MNNIDEDNIKKIIQENVKNREIKLDSTKIIARFQAKNETLSTKQRHFSSFQLKMGLSFISAFLVIGALAYVTHAFSLLPSSTSHPSSVITPGDELYNAKVADGKEGEFLFMVSSGVLYANESNRSLPLEPRLKYYAQTSATAPASLEATLEQTLPLIEEIFAAKKGYQFKNHHGGAYSGKHGTYPHEYIINETTRIVVNVEIDNDVDTEIVGEVSFGEHIYRIQGEKKGDKQKGQMNFALKVEYSNDAYIQITSKNDRDEQMFTYELIVAEAVKLFVEIASQRRGQKNNRFVSVDVVHAGTTYQFEVERRGEKYFVTDSELTISVTKNEDDEYVYHY